MKSLLCTCWLLAIAAVTGNAQTVAELIGDRAPTAILRMMPSDTPANERFAELEYIAGFEVIGEAVPLGSANANAIAEIVKTPEAFVTGEIEKKMRPGVAYRFGSGDDAVDMLVCFSCDKIGIVRHGEESIVLMQDIPQSTRDVLLSVAKAALPNDEAIQELPRIRSKNPIPPPAVPVPDTDGDGE